MGNIFNLALSGAFFFAVGVLAFSAPEQVNQLVAAAATGASPADKACMQDATSKRDVAVKLAKADLETAKWEVVKTYELNKQVCAAASGVNTPSYRDCVKKATEQRDLSNKTAMATYQAAQKDAQASFEASRKICTAAGAATPSVKFVTVPTMAVYNQEVQLVWSSSNASTCKLSGPAAVEPITTDVAVSGNLSIVPNKTVSDYGQGRTATYTLSCVGSKVDNEGTPVSVMKSVTVSLSEK